MIKYQEYHNYEKTLQIFNFIHSCFTCKKTITTIYIEKINKKPINI
jgi:PP-loop superfamily ATP-utilizing enzyme